jgi:hypothetical protein
MAAKLHLVKGIERDYKTMAPSREERFRYPADEEIWEVSCEPDRAERRKKVGQDERRAS